MLPVLFSIGNLSISSFGLLLVVAFLFGVFLTFRLARAWDLDEEKILDLTLLTFLGGLIGSRVYFGLEHPDEFWFHPIRLILIHKFPGFSFWGAFLGGWLSLYFFSRRKKMDFWQVGDLASVGFLGSLIFADIGCFLGGCSMGIVSDFLAVPMVGAIGKRFPVQFMEAILFILALKLIWYQATHFHFRGKIVIMSLIYIGFIKLLTEPFKAIHSWGLVFSLILIVLGITIFYKLQSGKRKPMSDIKAATFFLKDLVVEEQVRKVVIDGLKKYWYNQKVQLVWKFKNFTKILRRFRVRFSRKQSKLY